ncbi:hypothetical protein EV424DRAFT_1348497 [Suillus variegatus]|nr:hypothetical protein EV424DRAFT_1348497 [Suillus variegatus]
MAPQAEILGDPEGCEDVLAATTASGAGLGIPKSRAKASRGRKKKSLTLLSVLECHHLPSVRTHLFDRFEGLVDNIPWTVADNIPQTILLLLRRNGNVIAGTLSSGMLPPGCRSQPLFSSLNYYTDEMDPTSSSKKSRSCAQRLEIIALDRRKLLAHLDPPVLTLRNNPEHPIIM